MDSVVLEKKLRSIDAAIRRACSDNEHAPSLDGVASAKDYCNAKCRILLIAKEPHVPGGDVEDPYEYLDYGREECRAGQPKKNKNRFMDPLKYIAYGILNGIPRWDDIADANKCLSVFRACCSTALINLSKTPGPARSNRANLMARFREFRRFVLRQIDALRPNVVICLGTMGIIGPDLGFQDTNCIEVGHAKGCKVGRRVLVHAYHPVQSENFPRRLLRRRGYGRSASA